MKLLCVDNFDSFIYNLVYEFESLGCEVTVVRNDIDLQRFKNLVEKHDAILLSPGPGSPKQAGNLKSIIKKYAETIPMLGVCLGHQAIIETFGGSVVSAPEVIHGKTSSISFSDNNLFLGIKSPQQMARYHSLLGANIPDSLTVDATAENGEVMAVSHKDYPCFGVQFHPESIMSLKGANIIENFINYSQNFIKESCKNLINKERNNVA